MNRMVEPGSGHVERAAVDVVQGYEGGCVSHPFGSWCTCDTGCHGRSPDVFLKMIEAEFEFRSVI